MLLMHVPFELWNFKILNSGDIWPIKVEGGGPVSGLEGLGFVLPELRILPSGANYKMVKQRMEPVAK